MPILKGRLGEFNAVERLEAAKKALITPLFEVPPVPWDFENERPAKTIIEHLDPLPGRIVKAWGVDRAFYIDGFPIDDEQNINGAHPMASLLQACLGRGLEPIPVVGLSRAPGYIAAAHAITSTAVGCALRLLLDDFQNGTIFPAISTILVALGATYQTADLILDLGPIAPNMHGTLAATMPIMLNSLAALGQWRSFVLASAAFPTDLSEFDRDAVSTTPRTDLMLWRSIVNSGLARKPTFSDYAVSHPEYNEVDPRIMKMSHSIRYTDLLEWIIVKGHAHRKGAAPQYGSLCTSLRGMPVWKGAAFSWGDNYIEECATGRDGPGNATTWRAVGTNHHLTQTADQIAIEPGL
jgi:hypothetical protein